MSRTQPSILFFAPYAGLWPHAMPEALVAASLLRAPADVVYLTCDGAYADGCTVMSAHRLSGESSAASRARVCGQCRKRRDLIVGTLGVSELRIDTLLDSEVLASIDEAVASVTTETAQLFSLEGFPLGRYALHETIINFKLTSLDEMTPQAFADFRLKLRHVLVTYHACRRLLEKSAPDRIVTYNTHISTNYTLMNLAESRGIPTFGLHAGGNMSDRFATLYVFRRDMVVLFKDWIRKFEQEWQHRPGNALAMRNSTRHFMALASGKTVWVYSAPKSKQYFDVRKFFSIKPHQKVLLATLSSYDEVYSSQIMGVMDMVTLLFPTQVEWMKALISWMETRPDLFLIIRVHPRELPNLRDTVHSSHAKRLAEALTDLPDNVCVNWPSQNVSLYDLAPHTDLGLNGWSSAGKELSLLGIPVVLFNKHILFYPSSLNYFAKDRETYFSLIDQALGDGWSFERIRQTYRWLGIEYTLGTIEIRDGFVYPEGARSLWRRALGRLKRTLSLYADARKLKHPLLHSQRFVQTIVEDKPLVPLQMNAAPPLTETEETRLLHTEIAQILAAVYPQIPPGASQTIDNLRRVANSGT